MPEPDLLLIENAVRQAGAIARTYQEQGFKTWSKPDGSVVTDADLAVNAFLAEQLRAARPDYAWLSEETEDDRSRFAAARTFVVDPIDGTSAFVKRRPHFTICAGIVENGVATEGAVYNPMTDECFTAAAGQGAWLNGAPIAVSSRDTLDGCRLLASKSTLASKRWAPWPAMHVEVPNSIAYRMALVACGRFNAAITMAAIHDWDIAAADLILREAGGIITTLEGVVPRYNQPSVIQPSVLAAGPALHAILRSRLDTHSEATP